MTHTHTPVQKHSEVSRTDSYKCTMIIVRPWERL